MIKAKPFIKWVGGKTQLIKDIDISLPKNSSFTYIEPFLGSGAILFHILNNTHTHTLKIIVNDLNSDLINTYEQVVHNTEELIIELDKLQKIFHNMEYEQQKIFYNQKRELFNKRDQSLLIQASIFIFMNKTCFNGLYRVNKKNQFNVPMGKYKNPLICDADNLRAVSKLLKDVIFLNGDYSAIENYVDDNTLIYLDPPYKPLTKTSSFTSYQKEEFGDNEQLKLRDFLKELKCKWILSNSDCEYFDEIYKDFNIQRVYAKRSINSNGEKRGKISEIIVKNF